MSKVVKGNVVDALLSKEVDFIAHICNCQGVMGSGVAKEIKQRVPDAFEAYRSSELRLGSCVYAESVFNLLAQDRYGYDKRHLNYGALAESLMDMSMELFDMRLNKDQVTPKFRIGIPYKIGCDRAGGDWEVVKEMIEHILKQEAEVIFYKLEGNR